jgi:hypothetical protein
MVDVDVQDEDRVRVRAPYVDVEVDRPRRRERATFSPVPVTVDHATIARRDLDQARAAYDAIGLTTCYGGAHTNGATHMAVVAFPDGSYLELIAPVNPDERNFTFWATHLLRGAGPCGWAARSNDVAADATRLLRADGTELRWKIAIAGGGQPGSVLPFMIEDLTERTLRVEPSPAGGSLQGVAWVVIGVDDLEDAVGDFQQAYGWPDPDVQDDAAIGARLVHFADTPVVLASPLREDNWLDARLDELGDAPVAYLIGTADLDAAAAGYALQIVEAWFGRRIAWFNPARVDGTRLGVLEVAASRE